MTCSHFPKKGCAKKKKKELLLYRWTRLTAELHPTTKTSNPYLEEVDKIKLDIHQELLLADVIHAITLMNKEDRTVISGKIISAREDVINAIQLLLPASYRLTNNKLETLNKLEQTFGEAPFTYLQACQKLKMSHTSLKRHLQPLKMYRLVQDLEFNSEGKRKMQLVPRTVDALKEDSSIYTQMMEEWNDFQGFTDLRYRT